MNMIIRLASIFWCLPLILVAQESTELSIRISKTGELIELDGRLDEAAWENAQAVTGFSQNFPFDTALAAAQTEVRMLFDQQFLYIGARIEQPQAEYIISSLRRDFGLGANDYFGVNIDPFRDQLNGFHFGVSPLNVQREGLIDNGNNIPLDWDNKWYSAVSNHLDHWVVEMAIPFKSIRYQRQNGENQWRINFTRRSVKANENSSWAPVPRQFGVDHLAFSGQLIWEEAPPRPGSNVSVIPYLTASTSRDFELRLEGERSFDAGGDAKIAITPSLNLDLTFNPDFSQVDVDQQITNLDRFELFFPERRQFFLENEDLFSRFGFPNSRPFFSRRIGLASGTVSETTTGGEAIEVNRSVNVPILAGARLSGKLDDNWRIGLLNMQTAREKRIGLNAANYTVGVIQRKVQQRSTIGAVFVNKENFFGADDVPGARRFNRVAGLEYNFYSPDNKWESELFYHRSFNPGDNRDAQAGGGYVGFNTRNFRIWGGNQYIGRNHQADVGFVPRTGFNSSFANISISLFPRDPERARRINNYLISIDNSFTWNVEGWRITDRSHNGAFVVQYPGGAELAAGVYHSYTYLFFSFDPTNSGGRPLPEGTDYTATTWAISGQTDQRKDLFFKVYSGYGTYYNGNRFNLGGFLSYRWQPYGTMTITFDYNDIELPDPYNSASFWLIGPRVELAFSRSLFFSTFVQYNTQADNINVNSRLQWRFRPVSDIFLVYTDNYFADGFFDLPREKNRALVLKATYWLNL